MAFFCFPYAFMQMSKDLCKNLWVYPAYLCDELQCVWTEEVTGAVRGCGETSQCPTHPLLRTNASPELCETMLSTQETPTIHALMKWSLLQLRQSPLEQQQLMVWCHPVCLTRRHFRPVSDSENFIYLHGAIRDSRGVACFRVVRKITMKE